MDDIIDFSKYKYTTEIKLKELAKEMNHFSIDEQKYIQNNARLDVVIYSKYDNQLVLAIEVDGFEYHDNRPEQLVKDKLKDDICDKLGIPLLRLKTYGSNEKEKIQEYL